MCHSLHSPPFYLLAVMQQFFMMESFRYGILSLPLGEALTSDARKEHLLYQLQRMFGWLELSHRRAYDPAPWCVSYKDMDGKPTNFFIQQDAQEYLTTLLDRVEFGLKGTPRAGLVQQVLGLETREARYCTGGCNTVKTSSEPHVCLTIEVTKGNMTSALDGLTAWEDIQGYDCEACGRKTTLRKRNTLGSLSNTLIVHLNRFEMNYETGLPSKLNNRFEFPSTLDLGAYSFQSWAKAQAAAGHAVPDAGPEQPPEYYSYQLVGVVVHTGTLESGHYYSFIKERGPRAAAKAAEREAALYGQPLQSNDAASGGSTAAAAIAAAVASGPGGVTSSPSPLSSSASYSGRWLEFNDHIVSDFDPANIPAECFGGTIISQHAVTRQPMEVPVVKNAYMLVYERSAPQPVPVSPEHVPHLVLQAPGAADVIGTAADDAPMSDSSAAASAPSSAGSKSGGSWLGAVPGFLGNILGSVAGAPAGSDAAASGGAMKRARTSEGGASTTTSPPAPALTSLLAPPPPAVVPTARPTLVGATSSDISGPLPPTHVPPTSLVPRDPISGRGYLPASVAEEVLSDNAVLARNVRLMDPDLVPFLHLTADSLSRHGCTQPVTSDAVGTVPVERLPHAPLPQDSVTNAEAVLRAAIASESTFASPENELWAYEPAEAAMALVLHAFLPIARAAHGPTVIPHLTYTLCRLVAHVPVAEHLLRAVASSIPGRDGVIPTAPLPSSLAEAAAAEGSEGGEGVQDKRLTRLGFDLMRDALFAPVAANTRASFGRLLLTALLATSYSGPEPKASKLRAIAPAPADSSHKLTYMPDTITRDFLRRACSLEYFDIAVSSAFKQWDQYFGVLYDYARGGFGCGLPLVLTSLPADSAGNDMLNGLTQPWPPAAAAATAGSGAGSAAAGNNGSGGLVVPVSEALAAWAEGRFMAAPSVLSPRLRAPSTPTPKSSSSSSSSSASSSAAAGTPTSARDETRWRFLLVAGYHIRRFLQGEQWLAEKVMDLYLGKILSPGVDLLAGAPASARAHDGAQYARPQQRKSFSSRNSSGTPVWVRAFDLMALLLRCCYNHANGRALAPTPPGAVLLGPVPPARHETIVPDQAHHLPTAASGSAAAIDDDGAGTTPAAAQEAWDSERKKLSSDNSIDEKQLAPFSLLPWVPPALRETFPVPLPDPSGAERSSLRYESQAPDALNLKVRAHAVLRAALRLNKAVSSYSKATKSFIDMDTNKHVRGDPSELFRGSTVTFEADAANALQPRWEGSEQAQYFDPSQPEGFTLIDVGTWSEGAKDRHILSDILRTSDGLFWGAVTGALAEHAGGDVWYRFPHGPNPEAVAAMAVHVSTCSNVYTDAVRNAVYEAICESSPEELLPFLMILEATCNIRDAFTPWRLGQAAQALYSCYSSSFNTTGTNADVDWTVNAALVLLRFSLLFPGVLNGIPNSNCSGWHVLYNGGALNELFRRLEAVERDPKNGWGSAPAWQAAAIRPEWRIEAVGAGATAPAVPASDPQTALQSHLLSRLAGPVTALPLREEHDILHTHVKGLTVSMKATLALHRLERAYGKPLPRKPVVPQPQPLQAPASASGGGGGGTTTVHNPNAKSGGGSRGSRGGGGGTPGADHVAREA